jgi:hypothetical protein
VAILLVILALNRRVGDRSSQQDTPSPVSPDQGRLHASDILGWEFEYARITASEAMQERRSTFNSYFTVVGAVTSGVIALMGQGTIALMGQTVNLPKVIGPVLLWLLCVVGWLYFLETIRLRQAWHDSARTMNQIKEFCIHHAKDFEPEVLRDAFRWKIETLPPLDKPWTVFFYSATLIGFLDSMAYMAGGVLLDLDATQSYPGSILGLLALFGLAFFAFHVWLYFAFMKPK